MSVCLVTTTFSPNVDDMRATLALKTAEEARKANYPLIVVDGSPDPKIENELSARGATVHRQKEPGMGNSRRQCLNLGLSTEADTIIWLEPEKHPMVPLFQPCINHLVNQGCEIVIPRRKTFTNYPQYQHYCEVWANWEAANITGRPDLDLWVGPRIMTRKAAELMAGYNGRHGDNWEILFVPMIDMIQRGWTIGSVTVDYIHPIEQMVEDDETMRAKRDKQRIDLIRAMQTEADFTGLKPSLVWAQ